MKIRKILSAAAFAALLAGPANAADDTVIAKVDGVAITQADIDAAAAANSTALAGMPEQQRRSELLAHILEHRLLSAAAEKESVSGKPSLDERMKYYKMRAQSDLYFESKIRDTVTEAAARKLYDEQIGKVAPETEVRARHILVDKEDEIRDIAERVARGDDFAELAKEKSKDGSAKDGGDLGYFTKGQMVEEFETAAFKLNKGDVSEPIKTQFGWHIIKLEDKRETSPPPFDEMKDRIIAFLIEQKSQEILGGLREKAKIEIVDAELKKALEETPRGSFAQ
ncbi:MAG: peptidylprolyl isomerase [Pseudomonadota bacterium]|nr:peptidylprolyl isomerase [Pseudomonadota bacterium]